MARTRVAPTVARALRVLEAVQARPQGVTASELRRRLPIPRSSLFPLLRALHDLGYLEQSRPRGPYRPGPRLAAWGRPLTGALADLVVAFEQVAQALPLEETVALAVRWGGEIRVVAQREGAHRIRGGYGPGESLAPGESAAPEIFRSPPSAAVRARGYALWEGPDTLELAFPVCADGRTPNAALLAAAPRHHLRRRTLLRHVGALRTAAARLSYRQGALVYHPYGDRARPPLEKESRLSPAEVEAFLREPWTARLACLRRDGTPHVVSVWHEWDGEAFYVAAWQGSRWPRWLEADARVSLSVDEPWPPLRRVYARGEARRLEAGEVPGGLDGLLARLAGRYLGASEPGPIPISGPVFRIVPSRLQGWRGAPVDGR